MDVYEYVTYFLHGDYMSSLSKKVSANWLRKALREYGRADKTVAYWNQLIHYFILPWESPGTFQSLQEVTNWINHKYG